jgi:hypothetical protein
MRYVLGGVTWMSLRIYCLQLFRTLPSRVMKTNLMLHF